MRGGEKQRGSMGRSSKETDSQFKGEELSGPFNAL